MNYTIYNSKLNKIICLYLTTANFSREERSEERGKLEMSRKVQSENTQNNGCVDVERF